MMVVAYLISPTYMLPLFKSPTGLIAIAVAFVWETIGCVLLERGNPPASQLSRKYYASPKNIAIIVIFVVPAILIPMLGPAVITILDATKDIP